ncbi:flagellar motor protein MotB [Endozoicomonas sp. SCSIO W0465]|uniref:flagellar motor protein MotB n=1 Tax=Endozoicomonas sp. SCSIO W0465 TaxID=2918516 RepID=UPI002075A1D7|nr:flagellar motor protein MotB [Endozoicomonas sp. SCSIO W0465]USE38282.1 OmpA family protein [Endozoicomonas sp. SCSIO W0465]
MAKSPDNEHLIVVRRGRGSDGDGHHGGSWKVAFADFAMAMMALFLVLWLVAATTPVQKEAIATYFSDPGFFNRVSSNTPVEMQGDYSILRGLPVQIRPTPSGMTGMEMAGQNANTADGIAAIVLALSKLPKEQADAAKEIQLRIWPRMILMSLVQDKAGPMFPSGSSQLVPFYEDLLIALAPVLAKLPFKIIITGHSDGVIGSDLNTSIEPNRINWELSGQRAETVREVIVFTGVPEDQVMLLVAMGANQPIRGLNPDSGLNRRVDFMLVPRQDAKALRQEFRHKEKTSSPVPSSDMKKAIQQAWDNRYPQPSK